MSIANIRAFCSFLLPRHRSTNPQIELVASIAPPVLTAIALGVLQSRDSGFLSTLFSIRDVSQSTQAALLVTSGLLMSGSLLRREIALFTQSSYNTLAMLAASYASVSIINAYGRGQDLPSLVLITGFIAFSALINTSLYLYSNREKFSRTFDFSDSFIALQQLNNLIKDPTLNASLRNTFVEARKGLIHRIFSHPELFHASLVQAGHTTEEAKRTAVVSCNPDPSDPDKPLATFCLNFLFLWFFERNPPRHAVFALRPCRLAYVNALKVCSIEFGSQIDKVKDKFQTLKTQMITAIKAKDKTTIKTILNYLNVPSADVNKILTESTATPLGVEDLQRLTLPLPEDWELLYWILHQSPVARQSDWRQIETFCKRNMPVVLPALRSASVEPSLPAPTGVDVVGAGAFDLSQPGFRRRRDTFPSPTATPRGQHIGMDGRSGESTAPFLTPRVSGSARALPEGSSEPAPVPAGSGESIAPLLMRADGLAAVSSDPLGGALQRGIVETPRGGATRPMTPTAATDRRATVPPTTGGHR